MIFSMYEISKRNFILLMFFLVVMVNCSQRREVSSLEDKALEEEKIDIIHPDKASREATQALLLTQNAYKAGELIACERSFDSLQGQQESPELLHEFKVQIAAKVVENLPLYHWCYYQMVVTLDRDLFKRGLSFEERGKKFIESMEKLWILAKTLSEVSSDQLYLAYLRERYVQISKESFGRPMKLIDSPDGSFESKKAVGEAPVN